MVLDTGSFLPWVKSSENGHMKGMAPQYSPSNSTTFKPEYEAASLSYGTGSFSGYSAFDRFCYEPNQNCFEKPFKFGLANHTTMMKE